MTRDQLIELVARVDFEFMGRQNWNAFDKYERFAQLVAEMAYSEGQKAATLGFLRRLRQLHDSYSLAAEPESIRSMDRLQENQKPG